MAAIAFTAPYGSLYSIERRLYTIWGKKAIEGGGERQQNAGNYRVQQKQGSGFSDYEGTGNREQGTGNCLGSRELAPTSRYPFPVSCFPFPAVRSS
jgi:hypothetical protein